MARGDLDESVWRSAWRLLMPHLAADDPLAVVAVGSFRRGLAVWVGLCLSLPFVLVSGVAAIFIGGTKEEQALVFVGFFLLAYPVAVLIALVQQRNAALRLAGQMVGEEYAVEQMKEDCFAWAQKLTDFRMAREKDRPVIDFKKALAAQVAGEEYKPDPGLRLMRSIYDRETAEAYEERFAAYIAALGRALYAGDYILEDDLRELNATPKTPRELSNQIDKLKSIARRLPAP